ncbi:MAG: glycosyltransferase family 8 protein [Lachnospiraceae bacterium]|nr:glycosyltransferase family 8 protein [Lachnospiraceae bacterium]
MKINVVCAGNRNFIKPMKVMLKSLAMNTKKNVDIYVLNKEWERNDKIDFMETFSNDKHMTISFLDVMDYECLAHFKITKNIPIESYFRLFLPEILPEDIEQIIYLDGDVIVEGDIEELWDIPMGEKALMAVPEMFYEAHYVSSPLALHTYKKLNIPENSKYFNAGVLKINIKKWKKYNIAKKIIDYLMENKDEVLWHDQDGLNAILWNDWGELPSEWNVMTALFREENFEKLNLSDEIAHYIMENPKIIHYTNSQEKPWKETCTNPLKERYFFYADLIKTR